MKNQFTKTEELLKTGRSINLTASERAEMKSELLAYAEFHAHKDATDPKSSYHIFSNWWVRFSSAVAALLLLFTGGAMASTDSLPGDPLYAVKVKAIEPLVEATKYSEEAKLSYAIHRLEERLYELQTLEDQGVITEEMTAEIEEEIGISLASINRVITADTDESIAQPMVLAVTSDAVAVLKATEQLAKDSLGEEFVNEIATRVDQAVVMHQEEIEELVSSSASGEVEEFIAERISEISTELKDVAVASSTASSVKGYLEDVDEALEVGDVADAAELISEAVQELETSAYRLDLENKRLERQSSGRRQNRQ